MENGDGLVPLASRVERGAVPLGEGRRTVDKSGERARMQVRRRQYPSTKSKKSWAGTGSRDVVETRNHSCRGRASGEVLGVMISTGTEESRGYGEKHAFGCTAGVGWRTMPCPNDANEQTAQAP